MKSILVLTDRDWLKLISSDSGRGPNKFLGKGVGENWLMELLVGRGDEGWDCLSLSAVSFLEVIFLLFLFFLPLPGAMLEGDDVHLTEKKKGKNGREKKCET